jgi:hypothetical protein
VLGLFTVCRSCESEVLFGCNVLPCTPLEGVGRGGDLFPFRYLKKLNH